jgi:prepilin-type N-terminal cleavage/methylation domain-containing protein
MVTTVTNDQCGFTASDQGGFSLLETMIALAILAVVAAGVLPLGILAAKMSENQGHLAARTAEYAQDKVEQLVALAYSDTTADTRVFPATAGGGSGLTIGGSIVTTAPVALYADYLDVNGTFLPSAGGPPAGWYYMRCWQITQVRANLKQITVVARVNALAFGGPGSLPQSTVSVLKTSPF